MGGNYMFCKNFLRFFCSCMIFIIMCQSTCCAMTINTRTYYDILGTYSIDFDANTPNGETVTNMPEDGLTIEYVWYRRISTYSSEQKHYYRWTTTPSKPTCENYIFSGWYRDAECVTKFPPASTYGYVRPDIPEKIYAGWTCAHRNLTINEAYSATYYECGLAETYWECDLCKKLFSDENAEIEIPEPVLITKTGIEKSGTDINGITWELYKNGFLIISGDGEMEYYDNETPWESDKSKIKDVLIKNGITKIGKHSFDACRNLTSVTISDGVTLIDEYAFYNCESLTEVCYSGTKEEWNSIRVEDHNEALVNVKMHNILSRTKVPDDENICTIFPLDFEDGKNIILILYNNGRYAGIHRAISNGEIITFEPSVDYTEAKVVVWDDVEKMNTLCDVEKVL